MSKIRKIIDERETQTKKINKEKKKKKNRGDGSYSKTVRDKWFCWAFKLGFCPINM